MKFIVHQIELYKKLKGFTTTIKQHYSLVSDSNWLLMTAFLKIRANRIELVKIVFKKVRKKNEKLHELQNLPYIDESNYKRLIEQHAVMRIFIRMYSVITVNKISQQVLRFLSSVFDKEVLVLEERLFNEFIRPGSLKEHTPI